MSKVDLKGRDFLKLLDYTPEEMTSCLFFHFFPKILKEREKITI